MGMKLRGQRSTLILQERDVDTSCNRRPSGKASPPPLTKSECVRLAGKHIHPKSIWHVDGAQAYPAALKHALGAEMDSVNHSRPQKNGGPQWTKFCKHKIPSKGVKQVLAGTCSLDGLWTWMKKSLHGVSAQRKKAVELRVREFQWKHWNQQQNLWRMIGDVMRHSDTHV